MDNKAKYKEYYQKRRADKLRRAKEYYQKHRLEKLEKRRKYRLENKTELSRKFIEYYHKNRDSLLADSKEVYEERTEDNVKRYNEYKALHPCMICEEKNPIVLQFHHKVNRNKSKDKTVSNLIFSRATWDRILKEIDKCIILCANCHYLVHEAMKDKSTPFVLEDMIKQEKAKRQSLATPPFQGPYS